MHIGSSGSDGYDTHSGKDDTPPGELSLTRLREGELGGRKTTPSRYISKKDSTGRGGMYVLFYDT